MSSFKYNPDAMRKVYGKSYSRLILQTFEDELLIMEVIIEDSSGVEFYDVTEISDFKKYNKSIDKNSGKEVRCYWAMSKL